ncbi:MAG: hypothetical protein P1V36_17095, partial [Planctomycetota bacterium]|nr:hypothetical protein [Planctomycetota bacterium]
MARSRRSAFLLSLVACGVLATLAGCGEEPAAPIEAPPPGTEAEAGWSDHAGGEQPATAEGTPDGPESRTPDALLARLHGRVADGRGLGDATYERDVRDVAEVIWPADAPAAERAGAQVHMQLAAVAAEVS